MYAVGSKSFIIIPSEYILQWINGVGLNPKEGRTKIETKNNTSDKKSNTVELNSQAYINKLLNTPQHPFGIRGRRDRDRMVVRFTNNCAISAYHH